MSPFDEQALFAFGCVRLDAAGSPAAGPFAACMAWQGDVTFGSGVLCKGIADIVKDDDVLLDNKILPIPLENVTVKGSSILLLSRSKPIGGA